MSTGFMQLISAQQGKAQLMDEEAGDLAAKIKSATAEQKNLRAMTRVIDKDMQDHDITWEDQNRINGMMGRNGFDEQANMQGWAYKDGDWHATAGGAPDNQTAVNNEKALNVLKEAIDAKQKDVEADLKSLDFDVQGASADYKAALEGASNSIKLVSDVNSGIRQKTA